jgi:tRNA(Arg) A34 adenosine deaminase TadA
LGPEDIRAEQVFAPEFYRDCSETIPFWAMKNVESTKISGVVETISKHFPLNTKFNFLKRIHSNVVLIGPSEGGLDERAKMDALLVSLGGISLLSDDMIIETIKVPKFPVLTRKQYEDANGVWPIRVTTPLMDIDLDLAHTTKRQILKKFNQLVSGGAACLIESPDESISVLGRFDNSKYPLRHAVFAAADEVGKVADYLATDFSVYLVGEPCIMCSMALLHSRVKEVYFFHDASETKSFHGLGSTVAVHCNKQLNHRFNVYRLIAS